MSDSSDRDRAQPELRKLVRVIVFAAVAVLGIGATCAKPKVIKITSPLHGEFTTNASVTVTGTISGVPIANALVEVNGVVVTVQPDNTWSTTVAMNPAQVFNPIVAELTDTNVNVSRKVRHVVIYGDSVADGDFSMDSIALRLNDSGLDSIEPIVADLVDLDLAALLPPGTVVINDYCAIDGGFLGCLGSVDVSIVNPPPSFSGFGLNVDSQIDYAFGDVTVDDIEVNAYISGSGTAPSCGLRITADQVSIEGDYTLEPDAVDPSSIDVNLIGTPGVYFTAFDDEFTSGLCDFPLIGDLIQAIMGDIQPTVTNGLRDFLADPDGGGPQDAPIAEGIEVALADIAISGPIGESLGVDLEAPFFKVEEDVDGITLGSDGRVVADVGTGPGQCDAPANAPDLPASLSVPEPFPTFGPTTPISGLPYGLGISLSTAAFNQLLKAEIECGLLQVSLTEIDLGLGAGLQPITAGLLSLFIPELGSIDPDTPLIVDMRPGLAPAITGNPGPQGELAELAVGGLEIAVKTDALENLVSGQIDFIAGLDFGFDDLTGELVPTISSVTAAAIEVEILENPIGTNAGQLEFILQQLLPAVLPTLGDSLGSIPLPSFLGLSMQSVAVEQNGEFISLFLDLVETPESPPIASYEFINTTGANVDESTDPAPFAATSALPGVTAGGFTSGFTLDPLVLHSGSGTPNLLHFAENRGLEDGETNDMAGAVAADQWVGFTVTADPGTLLDLDDLTFDVVRNSGGALDYAIRTSVDGFAANLVFADDVITESQTNQLIDLSGAAFDSLSSIEIRIYFDDRFADDGGSSGTRVDNVVLNGLVVP
ncbi:MAG: hypothetical protein ACQGVK_06870 [Myxococcota bacterium]